MSALQHGPVSAQFFPKDTLEKIKTVYAGAFTDDIRVMICVSAVGFVASFFAFEIDPPPMPNHQPPKESLRARLEPSETELDDMAR